MASKKLKKFIVKRSKWLRGQSGSLRNEHGMKCCLGFVCQQLGARQRLTSLGETSEYGGSVKKLAALGLEVVDPFYGNRWTSELQDNLIEINDDPDLSDKAREQELNRALRDSQVDWRFEFVD